jgi:hypothetical protein
MMLVLLVESGKSNYASFDEVKRFVIRNDPF